MSVDFWSLVCGEKLVGVQEKELAIQPLMSRPAVRLVSTLNILCFVGECGRGERQCPASSLPNVPRLPREPVLALAVTLIPEPALRCDTTLLEIQEGIVARHHIEIALKLKIKSEFAGPIGLNFTLYIPKTTSR